MSLFVSIHLEFDYIIFGEHIILWLASTEFEKRKSILRMNESQLYVTIIDESALCN